MVAALLAAATVSQAGSGAATPPNVILIVADDLGWKDLSCQRSGFYKTPHIDRLASEGVRFTRAYAACSVCSPTRAALLTGRYPTRTGVTDWIRPRVWAKARPAELAGLPGYTATPKERLACPMNPYELPHEELTLAELLPAAYATAHIGKWHLGDEGFWPRDQGFEVNIAGCGYGAPPTYFDPYITPQYPGGIPNISPRRAGEYLTDREADEAASFIRAHRDEPFFLYLAPYAVHTPIQAKPDLVRAYEGRGHGGQKNATYAAMVHSLDEAVGKVMRTVRELGLDEHTLVVFTSDNGGLDVEGDPTDNAPLRSGKGYAYEGGLRVPLIVRWPGVVKPGATDATPVISMDVFHTVLGAAGVALPADRPTDGRDLMPILSSDGRVDPRPLFWHFPHYRVPDVGPYSVVRDGAWKLVRFYDERGTELYRIEDDVAEERDLASTHPDVVKELDAKLDRWLVETAAKLPKPNPLLSKRDDAELPSTSKDD